MKEQHEIQVEIKNKITKIFNFSGTLKLMVIEMPNKNNKFINETDCLEPESFLIKERIVDIELISFRWCK